MASVTKVISSWTFLIWQLMTVYPEVGTWHQEHFIYLKSMTIETNLETHHKQPGTWDSASYCPLVTSSLHILFIIRSYKGCNLRINLAVTRFPLSCPSPPLTLRAAGRFPTGHECSERTEGTGWGGVTTEPNRAERREGKVRGWWHDYRTALVPLAYRPLRGTMGGVMGERGVVTRAGVKREANMMIHLKADNPWPWVPASCRHPFRSSYDPLHSAPQAAVGERGEPERDGGRQEAEMQRLYSCLSVTSHSPFNRCIHAGRPPLHSPPARFTRPTAWMEWGENRSERRETETPERRVTRAEPEGDQ